jgi:cytochrome b561
MSSSSSSRLKGYRISSILLHWLAAALILTLFVIGQMAEGQPRDTRRMLMGLHFSLGAIAVVVVLARVGWRFVAADGAPDRAPAGPLDTVATMVKHLLYLVMLVLIVTGPLAMMLDGKALDFFGLFTVASPLPKMEIAKTFELAHGITTKVFIALFALHALGALKHLVIDRDGVFSRMLVPRR